MRRFTHSKVGTGISFLLIVMVVGAFLLSPVFQQHSQMAHASGTHGIKPAVCNGVNGITDNNGVYSFSPLHVASDGTIQDTDNCIVRLHGANWAGTDFKDAIGANGGPSLAAFQWFHDNENINIWRIWVNASWWVNNYPVPARKNMLYQDWIKQIVSWANQSGAYVLLTKGAQWLGVWDSTKNAYDGVGPCGGTVVCGHQNTANTNCSLNSTLCWQRGTGLTVGYTDPGIKLTCTTSNAASCDTLPAALNFWQSAAPVFSSNPGVLYDAWNEMHEIDCSNWATDNNALIPAIRAGAPDSVIFFGDHNDQVSLGCLISANPGGGQQPDYGQGNLVYDFHVYPGGVSPCPSKLQPTSAMWTQYPTYDNQVLAFTSQGTNPYGPNGYGGHGISFSEWGGSNVSPCLITTNSYDTSMVNFIKNSNGVMMYYDQSNLATYKSKTFTATSAGMTVAQDYSGW